MSHSARHPVLRHLSGVLGIGLSASALLASPAMHAAQPSATTAPVHDFCKNWGDEARKIDTRFLRYFEGANGALVDSTELMPVSLPREADLSAMGRFVKALSARGTRLVLVIPPPRGMVVPEVVGERYRQQLHFDVEPPRESYRRMVASLASTGAIVPDILAAALAADPQLRQRFYRLQDIHWRPEGAQITADVTAKAITSQVDLSSFPARAFRSRQTGTVAYGDKVRDQIERICRTTIRKEVEPTFVTEAVDPVGGGDAAADLLGDSRQAVVLVGTSFSRVDGTYNFGGFLSEKLSRDLLNVSIPGGGLTTSILSYFASGEFAAAPPAVLVWEVRGHELPNARVLDQLVSTLEEDCNSKTAVAAAVVPLDRGQVELLSLTDAQRAASAGAHYLDVGTGDTGLNKFRLRLDYADLSHEDIQVDQTRSTVGAGHFRFALESRQLRKLERVSLRPAASLTGKVSVAICAAQIP